MKKPFVKRIEHIVNNALDFIDKSVTDKIVFPIDDAKIICFQKKMFKFS